MQDDTRMQPLGPLARRVRGAMETLMRNAPGRPVSATAGGDRNVCSSCGGAGYLRYDVPVGHPLFGQVVPCRCREAELRMRERRRLMTLSGLRPAMRRMTFESYDPAMPSPCPEGAQTQRPGAEEARNAAQSFAANPDGWLYIEGSYGTGKTHLLAAISWTLIERQIGALYIVVPDLLTRLRETFDARAEESLASRMERIRDADVLLLDDLGAEKGSTWATEQLFNLVNDRYLSEAPMVVSSNLAPEAIGGRLGSRLADLDLVTHVTVEGPDYRQAARR